MPYLAASFFTENLFSSDPTILVDEIDPILEDFEAGGAMPPVLPIAVLAAVARSARDHLSSCRDLQQISIGEVLLSCREVMEVPRLGVGAQKGGLCRH